MTTQAPYQSSTFGDYQNPSSTTPTGTNVNIAHSLDPNVDSQTGTHNPTQASSTGAAGRPGPADNRAAYDPAVSGFNSSTGSGYAMSGGVGSQQVPSAGSAGYDRAEYAPSTAKMEYAAEGQSKAAAKGEGIGKGVKSAIAGVHGAGESLRGALNAAVDKAFGHEEGAARNEAIANRGEQEIRSGNLSSQRGTR